MKTILSNVYDVINRLFVFPLAHVLASRLPNRQGLVLFYNSLGYRGNSKYVYEWLSKDETDDVTTFWITHALSLYFRLRLEGKPVVYLYSPWGLYYFASAAVFCYDNLGGYKFPASAERFQMRHEIPVKYSSTTQDTDDSASDDTPTDLSDDQAVQDLDYGSQTRKQERSIPYDHVLYPSAFLAAGEEDANVNVVPLGFPRNDKLIHVSQHATDRWRAFLGDQEYDHVILYAPTSRKSKDGEQLELFPFGDFDIHHLVTHLKELNALLLIRPHPYNSITSCLTPTRHSYSTLQDFVDALTVTEHIQFAGKYQFDKTIDILPFVDVLITDYSMVYHTFLQLDRPILFFPYDYELFEQQRGFKYDYFENLPGPAINSFSEFIKYLEILDMGEDPHKDDRRALKDQLYDYDDAESRARVAAHILQLANRE